jgi:hypothetical protein
MYFIKMNIIKKFRLTLFWNPVWYGISFIVKFNNNTTAKRFRIVVEGVSYSGKIIHYGKKKSNDYWQEMRKAETSNQQTD